MVCGIALGVLYMISRKKKRGIFFIHILRKKPPGLRMQRPGGRRMLYFTTINS
jgi:hypothetical protein